MRDLPRVVAETAVGKAVPVKILRDGKEQKLDITLGRLEVGEQLIANNGKAPTPEATPAPDETVANDSAADDAVAVATETPKLPDVVGFDVAPLDDAKRSEFGIPPEQNGIVVTDVKGGSDADQKGIIPGLIVTEVNQKEIATVDELDALVEEAKEAGRPAVLFKVVDPTGTSRFIAVRLS
jgi:serine protease Do